MTFDERPVVHRVETSPYDRETVLGGVEVASLEVDPERLKKVWAYISLLLLFIAL